MVEIGREYEGDIFGSVVIDGNNAITETVEKNKEGKKHGGLLVDLYASDFAVTSLYSV